MATTNGKVEAISSNGSAAPVTIEDLYKYFGILADAKQDAGKHVDTYLQILAATKGGIKEKQLASQFITRFFSYFPKEMARSIDTIFDLCEDSDVSIRKTAIKDLAILCKDCTVDHLNKIADILTQLLQTEDQQEFIQVQSSLLTVFKQNPKSCLNEIFNQINTAEVEEVRKRAIKFLVAKIPTLIESSSQSSSNQFNKEFEDLVVKNVKQVLVDVDAEEFILFIRLLTALPSMSTLTGRQDLVNIIMTQSDLDKPLDGSGDIESLMILLSCIQQAIPLFSKNVPSTKYVCLYLQNVLSSFRKLTDENIKFEILKAFAELCMHYNGATQPSQINNLDVLYNLIIDYLPNPIEQDTQDKQQETQDEKFNFSYVECLLYSFHILLRSHSDYLNSDESKEKLRDFRFRLQYFAKGTQNYIKELRNSLANANKKEDEENKIRRVAIKVTTNIDTLIKDFFHNPPTFRSSIVLSWKSFEQKQQEQTAKRSLSVSNVEVDGGNKKKPERGIYHPPSGKYSNGSEANGASGNGFKRRTYSSDNHHFGQRGGGGGGAGFSRRGGRF